MGLSSYANNALIAAVSQSMLHTLRVRVVSHLQKLSFRYLDSNEIGVIMARVTSDVNALNNAFSQGTMTLVADLLGLVLILGMMLILDPALSLATFVVLPLMFLITRVFSWQARRRFREVRHQVGKVYANLQENISGVRVAQSFTREDLNYRQFRGTNRDNLDASVRAARVMAAFPPAVEFVTALAIGLVIVYGILRLVNFAYGELIMVSGYTMFLVSGSGFPWLVMAGCGVIMAIAAGIATDYLAFRPVRAKSVTAVLITSFAFSTLLQNAALLFISPRPRAVPLPELFSRTVEFAGVITPVRNLITIAVAVIMLAIFSWLMRSTALGIAMRAAATNFRMARMMGIPANLIISAAFAISGLLAGTVAILWIGRIGTVVPGIGLEPLLIAFIATVIGGMRSLPGAVVGGFLLALIDTSLNYTLPQDLLKFRDAFTFSLVILILLWRPEGIVRGPASGQRT